MLFCKDTFYLYGKNTYMDARVLICLFWRSEI